MPSLALSQSMPSTPSTNPRSARSNVSSMNLNLEPDKHGAGRHGLSSPVHKAYVPPYFFDESGQVVERGPPAPSSAELFEPPSTAALEARKRQ
ncbi:hypothetical protein TeGR_g1846, partial [Tetraparma gracilis]